jgi:hypothetical protein
MGRDEVVLQGRRRTLVSQSVGLRLKKRSGGRQEPVDRGGTPGAQSLAGAEPGRWREPQRLASPGQAAVFYDASDPDLVVGGGTVAQ